MQTYMNAIGRQKNIQVTQQNSSMIDVPKIFSHLLYTCQPDYLEINRSPAVCQTAIVDRPQGYTFTHRSLNTVYTRTIIAEAFHFVVFFLIITFNQLHKQSVENLLE